MVKFAFYTTGIAKDIGINTESPRYYISYTYQTAASYNRFMELLDAARLFRLDKNWTQPAALYHRLLEK